MDCSLGPRVGYTPRHFSRAPCIVAGFSVIVRPPQHWPSAGTCFLFIMFGLYPQFKMCFPGQQTSPRCTSVFWGMFTMGWTRVCSPRYTGTVVLLPLFLFFSFPCSSPMPLLYSLMCLLLELIVQCVFNGKVTQKRFSCTSAIWFTIVGSLALQYDDQYVIWLC